jgi:hypothetical protein
VVTVIVAVAVMLAVANCTPPANELNGVWEKLAMPNIYDSLKCYFFKY